MNALAFLNDQGQDDRIKDLINKSFPDALWIDKQRGQEVIMKALVIGDKAPEFEARDQNGKNVRLSDFAGKKVFLYFYPKANTSG